MIISHPQSTEAHGSTCESITQLIDLYPTLSELCGLQDDQPAILQGRSLAAYVKGESPVEQASLAYTITYKGQAASIRTSRWRYTRWGEEIGDGNEELYDHLQDPEEHKNLAYDPGLREILSELRTQFEEVRDMARSAVVPAQSEP